MAGSRTLKLSILADVDDLKKNLDVGSKEVEGFGGKLEKFSAAAKAAFLAAGAAALAYAGKLAVEGVQAAIADEAAQKRLETALKNATGATNNQIDAVEKQITKLSLATGVADDDLRPALQKLATATGDVDEAQKLLNLALDISAGTGRDVETVSLALAKAYDGNTGAITRLGVGLSAAEVKALGFEGTTDRLQKLFGGAATTQAETFEGRIARLKVAFNEAKESVGAALLPIIERLIKYVVETVIPAFEKFKKNAIDPVIKSIKDNEETFNSLYLFAKDTLLPFITGRLSTAIKGLGLIAGGIVDAVSLALKALEPIVNAGITAINAFIRAKNLLSSGPDTPLIAKVDFTPTPSTTTSLGNRPLGGVVTGGILSTPKVTTTPTAVVSTPTTTATPTVSVPSVLTPSGQPISSNFNVAAVRAGEERGNITVNVMAPSAIDEEGFTRAVVLALNNSTNRGTTGAGDLRTNAQIL